MKMHDPPLMQHNTSYIKWNKQGISCLYKVATSHHLGPPKLHSWHASDGACYATWRSEIGWSRLFLDETRPLQPYDVHSLSPSNVDRSLLTLSQWLCLPQLLYSLAPDKTERVTVLTRYSDPYKTPTRPLNHNGHQCYGLHFGPMH